MCLQHSILLSSLHHNAGLTLDRLELHDIGLPTGASASGIKQLALTNPCWEDLQVAMSPTFCPDLKVRFSPSIPFRHYSVVFL